MNRILHAVNEDKEEILELYKTMLFGPADWNEYYPCMDTIENDISRDALYVMKNEKSEIIAAISIDKDAEVDNLECWDKKLAPGAEFARICVRKDMQGQGISKQLIKYILDIMKNDGKKSVHILVKTGHVVALKLYSNLGFKTVGECNLYGKDFICMEMPL